MCNQTNDLTLLKMDGASWSLHQSNRLKFSILLPVQILFTSCFLVNMHQFRTRRKLRRSTSYHIIFVLHFVSFLFVTVALSLSQAYMFRSAVYPSTDSFCSFWNWFHYSPIAFCLLYPPMFYAGAIFLCPCRNTYDYTQLLCTWPCYFESKTWSNIDLFFNNYTSLFAIPVFCSVLYQRRTMQLLAMSSLYLAMWMPLQVSGIVDLYWDPSFLVQAQIDYMYLFPYFIHLVYPFIVLVIICRQRARIY